MQHRHVWGKNIVVDVLQAASVSVHKKYMAYGLGRREARPEVVPAVKRAIGPPKVGLGHAHHVSLLGQQSGAKVRVVGHDEKALGMLGQEMGAHVLEKLW